MKVKDLREYDDDTEILIEGEGGVPQSPAEWNEAYLYDGSGSYTAIVLTPDGQSR